MNKKSIYVLNPLSTLFLNSLKKSTSSKLNVFLDLDNTIINALSEEDLAAVKNIDVNKKKKILEKLKKFNDIGSNEDEICLEKYFKGYDFMDNGKLLYRIFERPHLQQFLEYLFKNFEVSVFTAASNDYASFIVKNIIIGDNKDRQIKYFFYSYHAEITMREMGGLKDLNLLWNIYKLDGVVPCNTVILDDNNLVANTNNENCIHVPAFSIVNERNGELLLDSFTDNYLLQKAKNDIESFRIKYTMNCKLERKFDKFDGIMIFE